MKNKTLRTDLGQDKDSHPRENQLMQEGKRVSAEGHRRPGGHSGPESELVVEIK